MADNTVQILVTSKDDAKPDLDALKARLDALKAEVATARATVDDSDAAAKLDSLSAKLLTLDSKTSNPKISIAGAVSAEAQIHAVEASLEKLDDTNKAGTPGWTSRAAAFAGAASSLTGFGDAITAANPEASMFQRVMAGAGRATGLFEPVVAGATVAAGGLASGLVAAGAGLGVFGLVAKSAYSQAQTALTAYNTAQNTTGAAAAKAMGQYQAAMAALPPSEQAFVKGIEGAQNAWQSFVSANTAGVTQILNQGMGLLPKILSAIQPLLPPVEKALSDIIAQLSKSLDSSGFKSFMDSLAQNTGPAIEKIATAIGHVITGIGGILQAFMPVSQGLLSGLDTITAKFAEWGATLSSHSGFQSLMETFKTETPIAMQILKNLLTVLKNVGSAMAGLSGVGNSKTLLQVLEPLSGILAKLSANQDLVRIALYLLAAADAGKKLSTAVQGIQSAFTVFKTGASLVQDFSSGFQNSAAAASAATGIMGTLGGKLSTVTAAIREQGLAATIASAATKVWTGIQAAFDIVMDANPIFLVVAAIAAVVAVVVLAYTHFQTFRDIVNDVGNAIKTGFLDAFNWLKTAVTDVVSFIGSHWQLLLAIITGPIGLAVLAVKTYWTQIQSAASAAWSAVQSVISTVVNAIKGIITTAFSAWVSLVTAQWNAIKTVTTTVWTAIQTAISTVVNAVKTFLTTAFNAFVSLVTAAWNSVQSATTTIWNAIQTAISTAVNAVKTVLNWFATLGTLFTGWWNSALTAVESVVTTLLSFVSGIPAKIVSALGNLGNLLYSAGASIIQGLINGINSLISTVMSTISSLGSDISSAFSSVLSILSPSKVFEHHGRMIAEGLIQGMDGSRGLVAAASRRLAGSTSMAGQLAALPGAATGPAPPAQVHLQLSGSGDQFLVWLRNSIRIKGGNCQSVLGTG